VLAAAQFADGFRLVGVYGEVETAEAFDGQNFALAEQTVGFGDWVAGLCDFVSVDEGEMRAALAAGVRLGVEAAVERVVVFGLALRAHGEGGHGGLAAVVGD